MNNAPPKTAQDLAQPLPTPAAAIARDYNFAADILKRNLDAGRGGKAAFIDHRGACTYADLAERVERFGHVLRALGIPRDDMCFWLYTSGSTGRPKGAVHSHADLKLTDDLYAAPLLGITENDICYSVAKLFFAYGLGNALTFPMSAGATTVLLPSRPTPDLVAGLLKKHRVTVFYAVPTFYAAFLAGPAAPARSEPSVRRCVSAGEALPTEIGRRWSERYG